MKTQIIQLESYDDVISIKDKIGWTQTARILLVLPSKFGVLRRKLELLLIKRHSQSLGAQLGLVTLDRKTRLYANDLGIYVFGSTTKARQSRWKRHRRKIKKHPKWQMEALHRPGNSVADIYQSIISVRQNELFSSKRIPRMVFFILGVSAVLAIVTILAPSATIELTPTIFQEYTTINILAGPDNKTISLNGSIPAVWKTIQVESRSSIKTSGQAFIPFRYSSGEVTFTNIIDRMVTVPAGTIIRSSQYENKKYITQYATRLPAYSGSNSSVQVNAINPGIDYDIARNELDIIEGPLGLNLTVNNPQPITGGYDQTTSSPTAEDYQRLYIQSINLLKPTALMEMKNGLTTGDTYPGTEVFLKNIDQVSFDTEIGEPADVLNLTLGLEFTTLIIQRDDLITLSEMVMNANMRDGFTPVDDTISYSDLGPVPSKENENSIIQRQIRANRMIMSIIDKSDTIHESLGQRPLDAIEEIQNRFALKKPTKIIVTPNWWPLMPLLPFRISVINSTDL